MDGGTTIPPTGLQFRLLYSLLTRIQLHTALSFIQYRRGKGGRVRVSFTTRVLQLLNSSRRCHEIGHDR